MIENINYIEMMIGRTVILLLISITSILISVGVVTSAFTLAKYITKKLRRKK